MIVGSTSWYGSAGQPKCHPHKAVDQTVVVVRYSSGCPSDFRSAYAAIVGTFASNRIVVMSTCSGSNGSSESW